MADALDDIARCLKPLESGDTLSVWKRDRPSRGVRDLLSVHNLQRRSGAG